MNFVKNLKKIMEFKNGDIIELNNSAYRDIWVLIHKDFCDEETKQQFSRKQSKNYLPFMMLSGLWYENECNMKTPKAYGRAYGKTNGQLTRGHFNSIKKIGNIKTITKEQLSALS